MRARLRPLAVALFWGLLCPSIYAAVTFDAASASIVGFGATSVTTSAFTVGAGASRAAASHITFNATTPTSITSSVSGVSGAVVTGTDTAANGVGNRSLIYCTIAPTSGASKTGTAGWTTAVNAVIGVITVAGANQTTPCTNGTFTHSTAAGTTVSLSVTSASGDLTSTVASSWGDGITVTNQTVKWGPVSSVTAGDIGPGTGTTTHTWTNTNTTQDRIVSGANFAAAGGGAAACTDSHMLGVWRCDEAPR